MPACWPNFFRAQFEGKPIFDALRDYKLISDGDNSGYLIYRTWEIQLRISLGMTIEAYSVLPVKERAILICSQRLGEWMSALQMEKANRERPLRR